MCQCLQHKSHYCFRSTHALDCTETIGIYMSLFQTLAFQLFHKHLFIAHWDQHWSWGAASQAPVPLHHEHNHEPNPTPRGIPLAMTSYMGEQDIRTRYQQPSPTINPTTLTTTVEICSLGHWGPLKSSTYGKVQRLCFCTFTGAGIAASHPSVPSYPPIGEGLSSQKLACKFWNRWLSQQICRHQCKTRKAVNIKKTWHYQRKTIISSSQSSIMEIYKLPQKEFKLNVLRKLKLQADSMMSRKQYMNKMG